MHVNMGRFGISFSFEQPFHGLLKTYRFVVMDDRNLENGPLFIREVVAWLWFAFSYPSRGKHYKAMKKLWLENHEFRHNMLAHVNMLKLQQEKDNAPTLH